MLFYNSMFCPIAICSTKQQQKRLWRRQSTFPNSFKMHLLDLHVKYAFVLQSTQVLWQDWRVNRSYRSGIDGFLPIWPRNPISRVFKFAICRQKSYWPCLLITITLTFFFRKLQKTRAVKLGRKYIFVS